MMTKPMLKIKDKSLMDCEVKLNDEILKLKSYNIYRDGMTSNITLELGYHDVELEKDITSDDVVLLKWRGMTFQRVNERDIHV